MMKDRQYQQKRPEVHRYYTACGCEFNLAFRQATPTLAERHLEFKRHVNRKGNRCTHGRKPKWNPET